MKTMLIPVDFSPTSDNAVNFAIEWSKAYDYTRIILLKSFYDTVFDHIVVSAEYAPVSPDYMKRERDEAHTKLSDLSTHITAYTRDSIEVVTMVSEAPLLRAIMEVVHQESPEMIVLGSDNYAYSSDSFIAGNVISITKISPIRVLIVPSTYTYQPVHSILVPCDYKTLHHLDKLNNINNMPPQWKDIELQLLNVDPKERYLHPDDKFREIEKNAHEYLQNYKHAIQYSNEKNVIDGILRFSDEHSVQLIISLPRSHSFLYYLTRNSIAEAICRNAKEPVMVLK